MDSDSDYDTSRVVEPTTKTDKLTIGGVTLDVTSVSIIFQVIIRFNTISS